MIEYLALAEDAAGVQHQEPQQPELGGRQLDEGAVPPGFMAVFVQFQAGDTLADAVASAQEDDRDVRAGRPHPADHLESVAVDLMTTRCAGNLADR